MEPSTTSRQNQDLTSNSDLTSLEPSVNMPPKLIDTCYYCLTEGELFESFCNV